MSGARGNTLPSVFILVSLAVGLIGGSPPRDAAVTPAARGASRVTFRESRVRLRARQVPFGLAVADLDREGHADIIASTAGSLVLLRQSQRGQFGAAQELSVGSVPRGVQAADVNGDGYPDVLVAVAAGVSVVLGGSSGFKVHTYRAGFAPFAVATGDLDGDGALDIAVANETNFPGTDERGDVSVFFGDGRGSFAPALALLAGTNPADVQCADFDGDGRRDLAVANWYSGDVSLLFNEGGRKFSPAVGIPYGGMPAYTIATGDIDGDGDVDMVVGRALGSVVPIYNEGRRRFRRGAGVKAGMGLRSLALADLNGDQRPDVATADTAAGTVSVLLNQGGGAFGAAEAISVGKLPRTIVAADVNRDGRLDLVVTNGGTDDISVLINQGPARDVPVDAGSRRAP